MHEHEVSGGVEEGEANKSEVVVEAIESRRHKVEAQHVLILEDALKQRHGCILPQIDGAAEKELEGLGDQNNCHCVVRHCSSNVNYTTLLPGSFQETGKNPGTLEVSRCLSVLAREFRQKFNINFASQKVWGIMLRYCLTKKTLTSGCCMSPTSIA